ncbi:hypothetical protein CAXC1_300001 [Candidatus Xenohaliotis californiensis]|uniref:Uncharacterized protein n=1 Tax=Candidatus Xenohaliotis californiensis TaxID=84677 RepID=A0ABM9N898_9RICK|nr:hypothetical protein CAXC1_300001 [Candidatus Xenohaliotis californiensis]
MDGKQEDYQTKKRFFNRKTKMRTSTTRYKDAVTTDSPEFKSFTEITYSALSKLADKDSDEVDEIADIVTEAEKMLEEMQTSEVKKRFIPSMKSALKGICKENTDIRDRDQILDRLGDQADIASKAKDQYTVALSKGLSNGVKTVDILKSCHADLKALSTAEDFHNAFRAKAVQDSLVFTNGVISNNINSSKKECHENLFPLYATHTHATYIANNAVHSDLDDDNALEVDLYRVRQKHEAELEQTLKQLVESAPDTSKTTATTSADKAKTICMQLRKSTADFMNSEFCWNAKSRLFIRNNIDKVAKCQQIDLAEINFEVSDVFRGVDSMQEARNSLNRECSRIVMKHTKQGDVDKKSVIKFLENTEVVHCVKEFTDFTAKRLQAHASWQIEFLTGKEINHELVADFTYAAVEVEKYNMMHGHESVMHKFFLKSNLYNPKSVDNNEGIAQFASKVFIVSGQQGHLSEAVKMHIEDKEKSGTPTAKNIEDLLHVLDRKHGNLSSRLEPKGEVQFTSEAAKSFTMIDRFMGDFYRSNNHSHRNRPEAAFGSLPVDFRRLQEEIPAEGKSPHRILSGIFVDAQKSIIQRDIASVAHRSRFAEVVTTPFRAGDHQVVDYDELFTLPSKTSYGKLDNPHAAVKPQYAVTLLYENSSAAAAALSDAKHSHTALGPRYFMSVVDGKLYNREVHNFKRNGGYLASEKIKDDDSISQLHSLLSGFHNSLSLAEKEGDSARIADAKKNIEKYNKKLELIKEAPRPKHRTLEKFEHQDISSTCRHVAVQLYNKISSAIPEKKDERLTESIDCSVDEQKSIIKHVEKILKDTELNETLREDIFVRSAGVLHKKFDDLLSDDKYRKAVTNPYLRDQHMWQITQENIRGSRESNRWHKKFSENSPFSKLHRAVNDYACFHDHFSDFLKEEYLKKHSITEVQAVNTVFAGEFFAADLRLINDKHKKLNVITSMEIDDVQNVMDALNNARKKAVLHYKGYCSLPFSDEDRKNFFSNPAKVLEKSKHGWAVCKCAKEGRVENIVQSCTRDVLSENDSKALSKLASSVHDSFSEFSEATEPRASRVIKSIDVLMAEAQSCFYDHLTKQLETPRSIMHLPDRQSIKRVADSWSEVSKRIAYYETRHTVMVRRDFSVEDDESKVANTVLQKSVNNFSRKVIVNISDAKDILGSDFDTDPHLRDISAADMHNNQVVLLMSSDAMLELTPEEYKKLTGETYKAKESFRKIRGNIVEITDSNTSSSKQSGTIILQPVDRMNARKLALNREMTTQDVIDCRSSDQLLEGMDEGSGNLDSKLHYTKNEDVKRSCEDLYVLCGKSLVNDMNELLDKMESDRHSVVFEAEENALAYKRLQEKMQQCTNLMLRFKHFPDENFSQQFTECQQRVLTNFELKDFTNGNSKFQEAMGSNTACTKVFHSVDQLSLNTPADFRFHAARFVGTVDVIVKKQWQLGSIPGIERSVIANSGNIKSLGTETLAEVLDTEYNISKVLPSTQNLGMETEGTEIFQYTPLDVEENNTRVMEARVLGNITYYEGFDEATSVDDFMHQQEEQSLRHGTTLEKGIIQQKKQYLSATGCSKAKFASRNYFSDDVDADVGGSSQTIKVQVHNDNKEKIPQTLMNAKRADAAVAKKVAVTAV